MNYTILVTCPKGIEGLLMAELKPWASNLKETVGAVQATADLKGIYQICLWSRLANRVLLQLFSESVTDAKNCYSVCRRFAWDTIFSADNTIAITFRGTNQFIRNEVYGAQSTKDAIVDYWRDKTGQRPNVDKINPHCRIHVRLKANQLSVYLDMGGHSLHQRGYRKRAGVAPMKENLACGFLYRCDWPSMAQQQKTFMDLCAGAGTILIEAALIATERAPGLNQESFGFKRWSAHNESLWQDLLHEAQEKHQAVLANYTGKFYGFDDDAKVLHYARDNIKESGLPENLFSLHTMALNDFQMPSENVTPGLIACNPPYGERMGTVLDAIPIYQDLGRVLKTYFSGWRVGVFTAEPVLAKSIGLRANKQYAFYNGPIACKAYLFEITAENKLSLESHNDQRQALVNRLRKNAKHLKRWRETNEIHAYRVYDADIPEYACAIDIYNDWAHVQEYQAPEEIPLEKTQQRLSDVLLALIDALEIKQDHIVLKQRKPQRGTAQYERIAKSDQRLLVREGSATFIVNCQDYLDTGLFLDSRAMRAHFNQISKNKAVLNLFCYTATLSVQAALGGAKKTVNVDMSRTYLDWAKDNYRQNGLKLQQHDFIQEDCLTWLKSCKNKFDMIYLDPPSFSNSKRMQGTFAMQRDHEGLIRDAMNCLAHGGQLYFSTHFKKFRIAEALTNDFKIQDVSAKSLDKDFQGKKFAHHCFLIEKK